MMRDKRALLSFAVFVTALFTTAAAAAEPVGTGFTYQGRLIDSNSAADGEYDLQFGLYDSNSDGNQVGSDIDINDVDVIDGYFTVELDFGDVFGGEARWLETGVRAGDSGGDYSVLSPRQEITATPYSQKSGDGVPAGFMILGGTGESPAGYSAVGISMAAGGEDEWGTKASMPTARKNAAAAVVGGKVYVIGGEYDIDNRWLTEVEAYDPETDSWATKSPLPAGRRFHAAATVGGKIYVFGGQNSSWGTVSTTYEYDPAFNSWTTKASMPTGRKYAGVAVVDGKIYVIGGNNSIGVSAANEMYDPAADSWTVKADMPTARQQLGVAALGGRIYAIGGYNDRVENEEYDPVSDSWTVKADMPTGRYGLAAVSVVNRIYAIGGGVTSFKLNTNEMYNPASDAWSFNTGMSMSRSIFAAGVVDGKVYAIGGDTGGTTAIATNEEFSPRVELLVYIKD